MTLIARLQDAGKDDSAMWCNKCGRVWVSPPYARGFPGRSDILSEGNNPDCGGTILVGTPSECIASLKARGEG